MPSFFNLNRRKKSEVIPGFNARFVHSENITIVHWDIEAEAELPEHIHDHEQIVNVIEGEFKLRIGKKKHILKSGSTAIIPRNIKHGGQALTTCKMIDAFYPVRQDYLRRKTNEPLIDDE